MLIYVCVGLLGCWCVGGHACSGSCVGVVFDVTVVGRATYIHVYVYECGSTCVQLEKWTKMGTCGVVRFGSLGFLSYGV